MKKETKTRLWAGGILFILLVIILIASGCAHGLLQLESGPYSAPDQAATKAVIGAGIGAAPGIIAGNKGLAWGGALLGSAIGAWLGNIEDQKNLAITTAEARAYRLQKEQEWKETYTMLTKSTLGDGAIRPPRAIVVSSERYSARGWEYDVILNVEQGLRQRGFEITVPSEDNYRSSYRRVGRDYSSYDADFVAEVLIQDLDSAIKITLTLRSLTGKSVLDRQGVGYTRYIHTYQQYGPSRDELRMRAAQEAARQAVRNIFTHKFEDTLEAGT